MKILFTSDLHGEISLYDQLLAFIRIHSPEIILLGGDLLPSFPPTKRYEDLIPHQKSFMNHFLFPFFERIKEITPIVRLFSIPGNWDLAYPDLFREPIEDWIDLSGKKYLFENGYEIIGYPFVPPTPFRPKNYEKRDDEQSPWPPQKIPSYLRISDRDDDLIPIDPYLFLNSQETIKGDLKKLPEPTSPHRTLYLTHSPPFGTCLDQTRGGKFAGSRSIRAFIEKTQPILTLHGHIHEAPEISGAYMEKIGKTIAINPGQFTSSDLQMVIFEIEDIEGTLSHNFFSKT